MSNISRRRFMQAGSAAVLSSPILSALSSSGLLSAAERMCADVARLSDEKWAAVDSDTEDESLTPIRETMKAAVLYALGYLFEHREEADHHALTLTLRSILFAVREGVV